MYSFNTLCYVQYKHFDLCVMYQITWALHVGQ